MGFRLEKWLLSIFMSKESARNYYVTFVLVLRKPSSVLMAMIQSPHYLAQEPFLLLSKPLSWGSYQQIWQSITPTFLCYPWTEWNDVHLTFYICLILADVHNNCSFQGLIIAGIFLSQGNFYQKCVSVQSKYTIMQSTLNARRYYVTTNRPGFVDSFWTIVMNQV